MKDLKIHPTLREIQKEPDRHENLTAITGFVGTAPEGVVRIHPRLSVANYVEIADEDIVHFDQNARSFLTTLYVESTAPIQVATFQGDTRTVARMRADEEEPDGGDSTGVEECVKNGIERCIERRKLEGSSPEGAKEACESLQWLIRIFCEDPIVVPDGDEGEIA